MCDETPSVDIDRNNCFNLYFDANNDISYTRMIDNKLYNITMNVSEEGLVNALCNLTEMSDEAFILTCNLHKSIISDD